jgi:hypothetical protein
LIKLCLLLVFLLMAYYLINYDPFSGAKREEPTTIQDARPIESRPRR